MTIRRSQSVKAQESFLQCVLVLFAVASSKDPSSNYGAPKRKTQWIFFVLKAWKPKKAFYIAKKDCSQSSDDPCSKIVNAPKRKTAQ